MIAIAIFTVFIGNIYLSNKNSKPQATSNYTVASRTIDFSGIVKQVYPAQGFVFPVKWNNVAKQLVDNSALNLSFVAGSLQNANEPLTNEELKILNGTSSGNITVNSSSAMFTLYVLWALGINNKNKIINTGAIMSHGNPYQLASTGGYEPLGNLSLGNLSIINLNASEQSMVESIASNVYRPCCDNPAMFPDCNHGAAQLGLIEIMASQGRNETQIYEALKEFNSFYYTRQYLALAIFFNTTQGKAWNQVPPSQILGYNFSSYSGSSAVYQYLLSSNTLSGIATGSGSACGV